MALTNILREPRREITETIVGIIAFSIPIWLDYEFAVWLHEHTPSDQAPIPIGMCLGLLVVILMLIIAFATHLLGEILCDALETRGIRLRPRRPAQ